MNLINDKWLPFKLKDGSEQALPISAICRPDVIDFALPRADFQGSAYQFAIGLLQTVFAPEDELEWHKYFDQAPTEEALNNAFNVVVHAFNADGDGPLFMQDFDALEEASEKNISQLLIETPGENGVKDNKDHFIKREHCKVMSLEMAVLALFTLQLNAPPNKACKPGRVSIRGGGPLTTLVMPSQLDSSLWTKLWLNVINREMWRYPEVDFTDGRIFPWLVATKSSEIYFHDVHPLHMFWAMPSRIRLHVQKGERNCGITGRRTTLFVDVFKILGNGNNYDGEWSHPLTPYRYNKKSDIFLSVKGSADSSNYKYWSDFLFVDNASNTKCAAVVSHFYAVLPFFLEKQNQLPSLWVFSYDLEKARLDGWYSNHLPIFSLSEEVSDKLSREIKQLATLSDEISKQILRHIKLANYGRFERETYRLEFGKKNPAEKNDNTISGNIQCDFWQRTESIFYKAVSQLVENTQEQNYLLTPEQAKTWLTDIRTLSLNLFDEYALSELGNQRSMAKRIKSRQLLSGWLGHRELGGKDIKAFIANHNIEFTKEVA
ncbi:type I-E CRISPR-associated protein Cse1/CasA [Neptunicella sp.]|uniref:type I-E CRISPR-associated protein Cse1/CasA n=1 Tax=Neptunicella sp. TaxID=2125986 RepID=UPI003F6934FD